ncbi:hypothetical protein BP6252_12523 [Coleophoma cylindrospora]|uniref:Zn(2)-C6 fungal-type domain-containing protein n=1 Tax=Coleophoma cylindrospora TaxID=1849047 RepID=A0A3D8QC52_9HELO|nr:hypothetical protein BP6252_12523 [Coleophoma cylindrospora]
MDTGASKTHGRTKIACDECRKNKRKCDGQRPTCKLCDRAGRVCTYASEASRKRKYVDEDLITTLQAKVSVLESQLRQYHRSSEMRHGSLERGGQATTNMRIEFRRVDFDRSTSTPYITAQQQSETDCTALPTQTPEYPSAGIRCQTAMEELASLMLTMDLEGQGEPSFMLPPGKGKSKARERSSDGDRPRQGSDTEGECLPTVATREVLMEAFMQKFNPFHQFLELVDSELIVLQHDQIIDPGTEFRNNALFAVGAHLSDRSDSLHLSSTFARSAESMLLYCIREHSSDLVCQGLSLLAWRELMLGNDSMAYNYTAMSTGVVLNLGLHVIALSQTSAAGHLASGGPARRKLRSLLLTSGIGMNCTMHWQRIRAPSFLEVVKGTPSIDEIAHDGFCQLWHLWDSCMDQVHAFMWKMLRVEERTAMVTRSHRALVDFYHGVDVRLQLRKDEMPESVVWFQMAYHAALLLIHRPFLNEPLGSSTLNFALRSATSAAASMSRIIRGHRNYCGLSNVAPQIIDYILSATVIHLLNATSGRTTLGRQSANGIRNCVEALLEMQPKWNVRVERSIIRIQELAHRWKVVWALPMNLSQPLIPQHKEQDHSQPLTRTIENQENPTSIEVDTSSVERDFWNPDQYTGALGQINYAWSMTDSWNLDTLFQDYDYTD